MITIKDKILNMVMDTINDFDLIKKNDKIIIGLSGGSDSLSLLIILFELKEKYNLKLMLAHLNHKLRKGDSEKDERFAESLSKKYDIPLKVKRVNIRSIKKKKKKMSLEEIGHFERYKFFQSLLDKNKFDKIALGHNLDDCIENFFLRSFTGGSFKSLSGIKPSENNIIRPLIRCLKKDLEKFLKECHVPFRIDCTNMDNSYPRNWIRNKLIPFIENNYKPIKNNMANLINILYHENSLLENYYEKLYRNNVIYKNNFYTAVIQTNDKLILTPAILRRILQKIFIIFNIKYNYYIIDLVTRFIMQKDKNIIQINEFFLIWKFKKYAILTLKKYINNYCFKVNTIPAKIIIENLNLSINIKEINKKDLIFNTQSLFFDKDKINKIIIRQKKINDYIVLMNTDYKTKLKNFFSDLKCPNPLKMVVPVIESNNEVIGIYLNIFPIFFPNRINENYKVTEKTKNIIKMEFIQEL